MIRIGPAGIPPGPDEGLSILQEKGLTAAEIPFTYRIWMDNARANALRKLNHDRISLSIHAPYYINLASADPEIVKRSSQRIIDCCERASNMGATRVVFHAGYRGKDDPYPAIRDAVSELVHSIRRSGWEIILSPETAGKQSQFGTVEELLQLKKDTGCGICIDFAHLHAVSGGQIVWKDVFDSLSGERHLHCHCSGIRFGPKGEQSHMDLEPAFFMPIAEEIVERGLDVTLISESPVPIDGATMMKRVLDRLKTQPI